VLSTAAPVDVGAYGHPATGRRVTGPATAGLVMTWISVVLWLDSDGSLTLQRVLGVLTWFLLAWVLWGEVPLVRAQTGIVVVFATLVEYTFSPGFEVYTYRFDNVPAYVPPGHGLVYLAALGLGRSRWVEEHRRACVATVVGVGGAWAVWGVVWAEQRDALGLFWYVCLVGFLWRGPSRSLYVGAFVVVSYLEVVGTQLGTWSWQPYDPTGIVAIGNPPTGAAGGYGWFDLAALLLAPTVLGVVSRRRDPRRTP